MKWFKKKEKKEVILPTTEEIWAIKDESPWPTDKRIKILDVKDGWVRYSHGVIFSDERLRLSSFLKIFCKVEKL